MPKISPSREQVKIEDRIVVKLEFLKPQKIVKEEAKTESGVIETLKERQFPEADENSEKKKVDETKAVDRKKITNEKVAERPLQKKIKQKSETLNSNSLKETRKTQETPHEDSSFEAEPQEASEKETSNDGLQASEKGNEAEKTVFVTDEMILKKVAPVYPLIARRKGLYGEVLLMVELHKDGSIANIVIKKSSGHDILDKAALSAVKRWIFAPNIGNAVIVPVVFELN